MRKPGRTEGGDGNVNRVDLHTHSTFSDGSYTPVEIVGAACGAGLRVMSLTDHDTVDGIPEALSAAEISNPRLLLIPGVEISSEYKCPLHILGYFRPANYIGINDFLVKMKRERHIRNLGVIEKLNSLGIRVTFSEVAEIAGKEVFGRPHIAAALVRRGVSDSIPAAFKEYLANGRKAYVSKASLPPEGCVAAISGAGGVPVIAHPSKTGLRLSEVNALAGHLSGFGLMGIEAYNPEHTPKETENYVLLAESLNLLTTGGSDFHGAYRKHVDIGAGRDGNLRVPDAAAEGLLAALKW